MEGVKTTRQTDEEPMRFLEYLMSMGLSDRTVKEYMKDYLNMPVGRVIDENFISLVLQPRGEAQAPSAHMIAFLKHYLRFRRIKDYEIQSVRGRKRKIVTNYISEKEYEALRKAMYTRQHIFGLMFDVIYHTGIRKSELGGLTMASINNESYHDFKEGDNILIKLIKAKNNKERYVILPPDVSILFYLFVKAREQLERHILANDQRIFNRSVDVFASKLRDESQKVLHRRVKPHDCRRNIATKWLNNDVPITEVQVRLGHESIITTELYAKVDTQKVIRKWQDEVNKSFEL